MAEYNTEQKKILRVYLKENCDRAYTIGELIDELREKHGESAPAKSTVYRLMPNLVEEGSVKRLVKGHGRSFVYQAIAGDDCRCHLHLKCISCGRLLHLDHKTSDELLLKVMNNCSFTISEEETVLLGKCLSCNRGGAL